MNDIRWSDIGYFVAELGVYAAVVGWGLTRDVPTAVRWTLAVGGFTVFAVSWGLLAAPRATFALVGVFDTAFRCVWFGLGAVAAILVVASVVAD